MKKFGVLGFVFLAFLLLAGCASEEGETTSGLGDTMDAPSKSISAPIVVGVEDRSPIGGAINLPIYSIKILDASGVIRYCTGTVYSGTNKHMITAAQCVYNSGSNTAISAMAWDKDRNGTFTGTFSLWAPTADFQTCVGSTRAFSTTNKYCLGASAVFLKLATAAPLHIALSKISVRHWWTQSNTFTAYGFGVCGKTYTNPGCTFPYPWAQTGVLFNYDWDVSGGAAANGTHNLWTFMISGADMYTNRFDTTSTVGLAGGIETGGDLGAPILNATKTNVMAINVGTINNFNWALAGVPVPPVTKDNVWADMARYENKSISNDISVIGDVFAAAYP